MQVCLTKSNSSSKIVCPDEFSFFVLLASAHHFLVPIAFQLPYYRDGVYFLLPFKLQAAKKSHLIFALQSLGLQVDRQNVLAICSHCIYLQFSHIMLLPIEA